MAESAMPSTLWPLVGALLLGIALVIVSCAIREWFSEARSAKRRGFERLRLTEVALSAAKSARKKTVINLGWTGLRKFVVHRRESENADICSFYLRPQDEKNLPGFKPGQYLTFQIQMEGTSKPLVRCYSLSDAPGLDHYRVSIKRVPAPRDRPKALPGLGSNFFHDRVLQGDVLDVKAPAGHYFLHETDPRPVCLLSAGIGITPVLSILIHLTRERTDREIWFFHGVREGRELVHVKTLRAIANANPNVHLHICFSNPGPADQVGRDFDHIGRVSAELLQRMLGVNRHTYYLCGPGPFMESLTTGLEAWGVPKTDVHFESFGPSTVNRKSSLNTPAATLGTALDISFSRTRKTVAWEASCATLLDFADKIGVAISSGCRAGNCGTCLTPIMAGEVEYLQPPGVPPEPGYCLVCIARPKTNLVLDS